MTKEKIKIAKKEEEPEKAKKKVVVKKDKTATTRKKKELVEKAIPVEKPELAKLVSEEKKILEAMTPEEKAAPIDYDKVEIKKTLVYYGIILVAMILAFCLCVF